MRISARLSMPVPSKEMDDLDEETLEGAADLGTMIREMSIDQITRSGNVEEEEDDDLEEEDAINDPSIGDLDESDEEDEDEGDLDESDTEEDVIHEEFAEGSDLQNSNGLEQTAAPSQNRST